MVKKFAHSRFRKRWNGSPTPIGESIFRMLVKMGGKPEYCLLASLWRNWHEAIGEDLAWISPKGHKDDILLLWAENSIEMQELSLLSPEILQRVNGWLKTEYFSRLKINLRPAQS